MLKVSFLTTLLDAAFLWVATLFITLPPLMVGVLALIGNVLGFMLISWLLKAFGSGLRSRVLGNMESQVASTASDMKLVLSKLDGVMGRQDEQSHDIETLRKAQEADRNDFSEMRHLFDVHILQPLSGKP